MDFDEMRKKMCNGRRVSSRDAHRHRAMRVEIGEDHWTFSIYGAARLPGEAMDTRTRLVREQVRRDSGLRYGCSFARKYRVPFENIEIALAKKVLTVRRAVSEGEE